MGTKTDYLVSSVRGCVSPRVRKKMQIRGKNYIIEKEKGECELSFYL